MYARKAFLPGCLVAFLLLARTGSGQTFGFYSSWSYDTQTGDVYMYAETWADYQIGYYYDLYVCMQLHVTPDQGNPYATCWRQDWSEDVYASVECSTTVPLDSDILLDSYHEATVTYYAYQFYEYCYLEGYCYDWWDAYWMDFLGIHGQTYEENRSWFAPGPPAPTQDQLTASASVMRGARIGTSCSYPTGETTTYQILHPASGVGAGRITR